MEKFECFDCGCYYWVNDRDDFQCPNCEQNEYKTCDNCSYDIVDDEGNIMEHYCTNDQIK